MMKSPRQDIRQCPAVSVVPVLTPSQPFHSSLLVLRQTSFRLSPNLSFLTSRLYYLQLTISLNCGCLRVIAVRTVMARAEEKLGLRDRPELFW